MKSFEIKQYNKILNFIILMIKLVCCLYSFQNVSIYVEKTIKLIGQDVHLDEIVGMGSIPRDDVFHKNFIYLLIIILS